MQYIFELVLGAVILASCRALLWKDVKQFYPTSVYKNMGPDLRQPAFASIILENCKVAGLVNRAASISGHACKELPALDSSWNLSTIEVHQTRISRIRKGSLSGHLIQKLDLSQNRITVIESGSFLGMVELEFLSLSSNPIAILQEDAFLGLDNLRELYLFGTDFMDWSAVVPSLASLPHIKLVDLGKSRLKRLGAMDLQPLENSTLQHLSLQSCAELTGIHPKALAHLKHLEGFYVRESNNLNAEELLLLIGNLTQQSFRVIDVSRIDQGKSQTKFFNAIAKIGVEVLIIQGSYPTLEKNFFPYMPNITSIVMTYSRISAINSDSFENIPNLRQLDLEGGYLSDFPQELNLPQLEYLDISGFEGHFIHLSIPLFAFKGTNNLKELRLNYKILPNLSGALFFGLSRLLRLEMAYCRIDHLPADAFSSLVSLTYLDLTGNPIFASESVNLGHIFPKLAQLSFLSLSRASMQNLPAGYLTNLTLLEELNLSHNDLSYLPDLINNHNLRSIDISSNAFTYFEEYPTEEGFHNRLPDSLLKLDLSHNKITYKINVPPQTKQVNLTGNPFTCDCNLQPLLRIIMNPAVEVSNSDFPLNYRCEKPTDLEGKYIVDLADSLKGKCRPQLTILLYCIGMVLFAIPTGLIGTLVYKNRAKCSSRRTQQNGIPKSPGSMSFSNLSPAALMMNNLQ